VGELLDGRAAEPRKLPWSLSDTLWGSLPIAILTLLGLLAELYPAPPAKVTVPGTIVGFIISFSIMLIPVYLIAVRKRRATAADFGFRAFHSSRAFKLIACIVILYLIEVYIWRSVRGPRPFPFYFGHGMLALFMNLTFTAIMTPIAEEVFFRGFLFSGLETRFRFWGAAIISGLVFGLGHPAIVPQATLGVGLPWLRERTGSLWPCIIAHSAINAILITSWFAATGTA
jgi:uncharacterized protein